MRDEYKHTAFQESAMDSTMNGDPAVKFESDHGKGCIEACKGCSGHNCCGTIREGGSIEPPFLTAKDIRTIEDRSGLKEEEFSTTRINPVTSHVIHTMKTTDNGGCVFFDKGSGKCQIHSFRPMDCRLFPLDIVLKDGRFFWALFNNATCHLTADDVKSLLRYKDEALEILGEDLRDYATMPVPGMNEIGYTILMEIER